MKIFVDTNVFLDILFKRGNYEASLAVFKAVKYRVKARKRVAQNLRKAR